MRVTAPLDVSGASQIRVRSTMASDPIRAQYVRASTCSTAQAEVIGRFLAWDPEKGAWPLSDQQRRILHEVDRALARLPADWVETVLLPMIDSTEQRVEPSLRIVDWFVTNYSKSQGACIGGVNVHVSYIDTRKHYMCRNFDPFRRNLKLSFEACGRRFTTTVGQLNFIVWADAIGVLGYVRQHREAIDRDMRAVCRETREKRQQCKREGLKRKRTSLSSERSVKCRVGPVPDHWVQPCYAAGRAVRRKPQHHPALPGMGLGAANGAVEVAPPQMGDGRA